MSKGFPNNSLWGTTINAYQVEGATYEDNKKASQQDTINRENHTKRGSATADIANDQYHHYKEGVAPMKEMGFTIYCFSIAWSYVSPDGVGEVSEAGIQYHRNLTSKLLANGIELIVILHHCDLPQALAEKYNGWLSREVVEDFAYFTRYTINESKDKVKYWTIINEQSIIAQYWMQECYIPEELRNNNQLRYQINHHMNLVHAVAYKLVHELVSGGLTGAAIGYSLVYPFTSKPEDAIVVQSAHGLRNVFYLDIYFKGSYTKSAIIYLEERGLASVVEEGDMELTKEDYPDFLTLNYYASKYAKACLMEKSKEIRYGGINWSGKKDNISGFETHPDLYGMYKNSNPDTTDWDWVIDPTGLEYIFRDTYTHYNKPLVVAENSMGAFDILTKDGRVRDDYHIKYLCDHVEAMHRTIDCGVEVLAYCPWSAVDPLLISNGVKKRYGFTYVDRTDDDPKKCTRIRKDSSYWCRQMIKSNGIDL